MKVLKFLLLLLVLGLVPFVPTSASACFHGYSAAYSNFAFPSYSSYSYTPSFFQYQYTPAVFQIPTIVIPTPISLVAAQAYVPSMSYAAPELDTSYSAPASYSLPFSYGGGYGSSLYGGFSGGFYGGGFPYGNFFGRTFIRNRFFFGSGFNSFSNFSGFGRFGRGFSSFGAASVNVNVGRFGRFGRGGGGRSVIRERSVVRERFRGR
jgi:hypothetical protein